ncbi:DUF1127 domain-containing protein [Bradyrhizobium sp. BR 10289]|uniref:DUF1127 domain-containing protein n=1 Tax=Bradyrhizobium sp. BR 10289 TaxID=2749993 RepID=UPI001C64EEA9|nr:DUF1127 domain-containing protein [Bradyrhizobium sp. BR 10289]MBW7974279.1 DUF1127 domain-containing protein [Bradyrhizobium sp. BR 10289]
MPPQQTTITPGTGGYAAARRSIDLSVVLSLLRRYWRVFRRRRQGQLVTLQHLSDRELMDIGLTRGEIDYFTPERAIDTLRDRLTDPWSRGVM